MLGSLLLSLFCTVIPSVAWGPFDDEFLTAFDVLMLMASLLLLATPLSLADTAMTGELVVSGVPLLLASLLLSLMLLISYCLYGAAVYFFLADGDLQQRE